MAETGSVSSGEPVDSDLQEELEEIDFGGRKLGPSLATVVGLIAATWSLFQLWIVSPFPFLFGIGIIVDVPARAIHLSFGLLLCYLMFPISRRRRHQGLPLSDIALALLATGVTMYIYFAYDGLTERVGTLLVVDLFGFGFPLEGVVGALGIIFLLEGTRRAIGLPLVIVASVFLVYSIFGQSMPDIISHKGVSLNRLIGYHWLGGEAIFGIPIGVSVSFVFLFVLFGSLLDKAGAGKYFLDLSFAMVGRYRGGPAKAAILASGMTGAISGSSIANVVTTGIFTIPVMKRMGYPAVKAGAIEVAASTNGQLMPPIMGAAAFIIAELLGISYFDVVKAAFIPAVISYIALIYISHLEALKLDLKGMPESDLPHLRKTFFRGIHFLIPIGLLVYLLMVERWTPGSSVFYSIMLLMVVIVIQHVLVAGREGVTIAAAVKFAFIEIYDGMIAGARNMIGIAIAVGAAGIIVGAVSSTGLNNAMIGVVEAISGGNIYALLILTAVLCLLLGMGLPTTANYLVVASLLAPVLVELGSAAGLVLPLIAVHLFVFYFGILADDTPPVCLAAFAAAAISRADPIRTGMQGFTYDIRTAILPFIFIFNPELLLIGVTSVWHGLVIFFIALVAMACFSSATQGWMIVKAKWYEIIVLLVITFALFRPDYFLNLVYPAYAPVDIEAFRTGKAVVEPGLRIRLHAVRTTDYGDRFKLYVLETPKSSKTPKDAYGVTLKRDGDRYTVSDLAFQGPAEKRGVKFGDTVTALDVEQTGRPAKEWIYPMALALLGVIVLLQLRRRRRDGA
jgi:TRAP transporter 4TM/12TM fusion protein